MDDNDDDVDDGGSGLWQREQRDLIVIVLAVVEDIDKDNNCIVEAEQQGRTANLLIGGAATTAAVFLVLVLVGVIISGVRFVVGISTHNGWLLFALVYCSLCSCPPSSDCQLRAVLCHSSVPMRSSLLLLSRVAARACWRVRSRDRGPASPPALAAIVLVSEAERRGGGRTTPRTALPIRLCG